MDLLRIRPKPPICNPAGKNSGQLSQQQLIVFCFLISDLMVLILDCNPEQVARALRKICLIREKNTRFVIAPDLIKFLTCAPIFELPSNISTVSDLIHGGLTQYTYGIKDTIKPLDILDINIHISKALSG